MSDRTPQDFPAAPDADAGSPTGLRPRALVTIQGASPIVRPATFIEALDSLDYRQAAAGALEARIAHVARGQNSARKMVTTALTLESWLVPIADPASPISPALLNHAGEPIFGALTDLGTSVQIPDRTPSGQQQAADLLPQLAVMVARLAIVKGWNRAMVTAGTMSDPKRRGAAELAAIRTAEALSRAGLAVTGIRVEVQPDPSVVRDAAWWRKPHWLRGEMTAEEREVRQDVLANRLPAGANGAPRTGRSALEIIQGAAGEGLEDEEDMRGLFTPDGMEG